MGADPTYNLTIQLLTTEKFHYSYVSSAAIKLNDEVCEFVSWGQVICNWLYESQDADLPKTLGGYPITVETTNKQTHSYFIDPGDGKGIEVKSVKEMVAVRMLGSNKDYINGRGLMGSPEDGANLGRDGRVIDDSDEFGAEWQVGVDEPMLFESERQPRAPSKCFLPKAEQQEQRRLGEAISRTKAEAACSKWLMNKEACISDVMISGDYELAAAFHD